MKKHAFQHDPFATPKPHESLCSPIDLYAKFCRDMTHVDVCDTFTHMADAISLVLASIHPIPKYTSAGWHDHPGGLAVVGDSLIKEMVHSIGNTTIVHQSSFQFPARPDLFEKLQSFYQPLNIIMVDDNDIMFIPNHMIKIRSRRNIKTKTNESIFNRNGNVRRIMRRHKNSTRRNNITGRIGKR